MLKPSLIAKTSAKANDNQIKIINNVRITYLTSRLIRVEVDKFYDDASFTVFNRKFGNAEKFKVTGSANKIFVETKDAVFTIKNNKPLCVKIKSSGEVQYFKKQKNLKGTRRTLDATFGKVELDDGLITKNGAYLLDDSNSFLLDESGHFVPRGGGKDYYCFAYGNDYRQTIKAFLKISGITPLVPRYALGVWWSRYHAYTDDEYLNLMDRFEKENVPLTVATIDMDWHYVDLKKQFGIKENGWTGYSWNKELFKDYKNFLANLQNKNLKVTLNLHPADGIRFFEDMYEDTAKAVGIDPESREPVKFSCKSDDFWNAYFDKVHKPYEKDGVDFWWIDWQQGKKSDINGLDPLNALNHYHFLDNAENDQLPLILSRYAGLGS
ncbi:MAG: glycoside hydrolase family 31 protein, partial [Eubacteriales bacterium]|nr:glycoside hydrolase family 31 protein [Eubacteriales bacterium]